MNEDLSAILAFCFLHFQCMDQANACVHTAPVRYSPITFRLAELLSDSYMPDEIRPNVQDVMEHRGKYEEDKGR